MNENRWVQGWRGTVVLTYPTTNLSCGCDDIDCSTFLLSFSHDVTLIKAFMDPSSCSYPQVKIPSNEYDPLVVGSARLGFQGVEEDEA